MSGGVRRLRRIRLLVQSGAFAATNLYVHGLLTGTIYTGTSKMFCTPGLHCYSCPSHVLACPLGSLQSVLASDGLLGGLASMRPDALALLGVLGFILAVGLVAGRFACGWICPFGLIQDLLHRIPTPELRIPRAWADMKYAVLLLFVILLPMTLRTVQGAGGDPWFCKAVCPSGTLTAGYPLVLHDGGETLVTGFLFTWKSALLGAIVLLVIFSSRAFCRLLCPLGATWGLAGKVSVIRMRVEGPCIRCGRCREVCPVDIEIWREPDSAECIRCLQCIGECPTGAISHGVGRGKG